MLDILIDYKWWIECEEYSCELIAGRVSYLPSPGIPWIATPEIVYDFIDLAVEINTSTTMYDLIQNP
jgi:hypothetical protein